MNELNFIYKKKEKKKKKGNYYQHKNKNAKKERDKEIAHSCDTEQIYYSKDVPITHGKIFICENGMEMFPNTAMTNLTSLLTDSFKC